MIGPAERGSGRRRTRTGLALLATAALLVLGARPAVGQARPDSAGSSDSTEYTLTAPSGQTLTFGKDAVRDMLDRTRRLGEIVERDPDVLYYVGSGPEVGLADPGPAHPWNAVRVQSDSVARVAVPGNYRESRRAYFNYAVELMERVREDAPAARCSTAVAREVEAVSAFVDGWLVTRFLYGGPAYAPLDALPFARAADHLEAMVVAAGDTRVEGCLDDWRREHPERMEAYRRWRDRVFPEVGAG